MRFPWSDDLVHRFVLEAEWFAGVTAAAPELQFVDAVPLGTASDEPWLLIVDAVFGTERQRYAVPVAADPACPEMLVDGHAAGNLLEGLLGILLRDGRITTERNNEIVLDGDPHEASVRRLPFDPGWSSNAVSLVDLNGRVCVHKLFRRLDENANEATLLRLLGNRTDTVPGYVLSYHYRDVRTNKTLPLGLVYAFAEGHGLDVPLRKNLRALLSKLSEAWSMPDHDQTERLAREHACQLRPVLVEVGQRLHSFHTV